jgi:hypothetical protein
VAAPTKIIPFATADRSDPGLSAWGSTGKSLLTRHFCQGIDASPMVKNARFPTDFGHFDP